MNRGIPSGVRIHYPGSVALHILSTIGYTLVSDALIAPFVSTSPTLTSTVTSTPTTALSTLASTQESTSTPPITTEATQTTAPSSQATQEGTTPTTPMPTVDTVEATHQQAEVTNRAPPAVSITHPSDTTNPADDSAAATPTHTIALALLGLLAVLVA